MSAEHPSSSQSAPSSEETLSLGGSRMTQQRRSVYEALMETRDHPTAVQVFQRTLKRLPHISLATVYNCLETLTQCGLARQVNFDRSPSRYCANSLRHGHFICTACEQVHDVDLPDAAELERIWPLPHDYVVSRYEFSLRGLCPRCAASARLGPATPKP